MSILPVVHTTEQQQALSKAVARAVAAIAGYSVHEDESDFDSVDMGFSAGKELPIRPRLEAQLKCSYDEVLRPADFSFVLSMKNYNDLRVRRWSTVLIVVRVPRDLADWATMTEDQLVLQHTAYWRALRGAAG